MSLLSQIFQHNNFNYCTYADNNQIYKSPSLGDAEQQNYPKYPGKSATTLLLGHNHRPTVKCNMDLCVIKFGSSISIKLNKQFNKQFLVVKTIM